MIRNRLTVTFLAAALLILICTAALTAGHTRWSDRSATLLTTEGGGEMQARDIIIGYNMTAYLAIPQDGSRRYHSFSISGNYRAYGLRSACGWFHYSYYAEKSSVSLADATVENNRLYYAVNTQGCGIDSGKARIGRNVQQGLMITAQHQKNPPETRLAFFDASGIFFSVLKAVVGARFAKGRVIWYVDRRGERKSKSVSGAARAEANKKTANCAAAPDRMPNESDESKKALAESMGS